MLMGEERGENVDIYFFLLPFLNDSSIMGRMWGLCWGKPGENVDKIPGLRLGNGWAMTVQLPLILCTHGDRAWGGTAYLFVGE